MIFILSVTPHVCESDPAAAFRPFKSTDADTVDIHELEIEFGALTVEREDGKTGYIVPSVILNYGIARNLEVIGEFEVEKPAQGAWEIADPGVFLKAVLKEGTLQDRAGLSFAAEFGALLPSSEGDEDDVGGEAILIASGRLAPLTYHLNLGGGIDRAGDAFWTWGAIGEVPVLESLILVGEVTGEDAADAKSDHSALIGALFEPPESRFVFDIGIRRGISSDSADWSATFGLTASF